MQGHTIVSARDNTLPRRPNSTTFVTFIVTQSGSHAFTQVTIIASERVALA
jgi:hypothetical protein